MREVGLIKHIQTKWIPNKPLCGGRDFATVGLSEVRPILFAYLFGFVGAFGLWLIEMIVYRYLTYRKQRQQIIKVSATKLNDTIIWTDNVNQLLSKYR